MNTYLGRMYDIHPNAELEVVQLNCLNPEYQPSVSENWCTHVRDLLNIYNFAIKRHTSYNGLTWYNNSTWYKTEAENFYDFMNKFQEINREYFIEKRGKFPRRKNE